MMSHLNLLALPSDVLDPVVARVNGATKVQLTATCRVLGQRFADPQVRSAAVRNADQVTVACKHSISEEPCHSHGRRNAYSRRPLMATCQAAGRRVGAAAAAAEVHGRAGQRPLPGSQAAQFPLEELGTGDQCKLVRPLSHFEVLRRAAIPMLGLRAQTAASWPPGLAILTASPGRPAPSCESGQHTGHPGCHKHVAGRQAVAELSPMSAEFFWHSDSSAVCHSKGREGHGEIPR